MRDQLEEAHRHRDDGYGRAQHLNQVELPKRFYKDVGVAPVDGGFAVTLDGRQLRTPGKKIPIALPAAAIATTLAREWTEQDQVIDAAKMPMTRLINSAIESGEASIPAFRAEIVKFAASDLLLYRAESPQELISQQEVLWDNALEHIARHFGVRFEPTAGIMHKAQPQSSLDRIAELLEAENLLVMTALVSITGLTGSGLLAVCLWHGLLSPEQVWTAAHVDEDYQIALWGRDEEAEERRAKRRVEFDVAVALLDALRA